MADIHDIGKSVIPHESAVCIKENMVFQIAFKILCSTGNKNLEIIFFSLN